MGRTIYELLGALFFAICAVMLTAHLSIWMAWSVTILAFIAGWGFMGWATKYGYGPDFTEPGWWGDDDE